MQSRKYEIQQKKLAVRRLSHGSRKGPLSPTGDKPFMSRKRGSPEDIRQRQRKIPRQPTRTNNDQQREPFTYHRTEKQGQEGHVTDSKPLGEAVQHRKNNENLTQPLADNPFLSDGARTILGITASDRTTASKSPLVFGQQMPDKYNDLEQNTRVESLTGPSNSLPQNVSSTIGSQGSVFSSSLFPTGVQIPVARNTKTLPVVVSSGHSLANSASDVQELTTRTRTLEKNLIIEHFKGNLGAQNPFVPARGLFRRGIHDLTKQAKKTDGMFQTTKDAEGKYRGLDSESVLGNSDAGSTIENHTSSLRDFSQTDAFDQRVNDTVSTTAAVTSIPDVFLRAEEEVKDCTAIKVIQIPEQFLDKTIIQEHFSLYGRIKRVRLHARTRSAVVTFFDHGSAVKAKENGTAFSNEVEPVVIFWYQRPSKVESNEQDIMSEVKNGKAPKGYEKKLAEIKNSVGEFVNTITFQTFRDASDKAEMLGNIDKIIRDGLYKETDLKKATAVIGTCQDMCPERERYLRQDQRRLSIFEMLPGTENAATKQGEFPMVDHRRAVKEYSRSSADQEEPLPHELRPPAILTQTMNYLIWSVMDLGEGRWADWYDFVWNRTRGVRKDITQQHLSDETSVALIEKCARFHILCAHQLCEESINAFDMKINNENLTKCLQSLKQMYEDLKEKGVTCENEKEFRCYQILLNLNNADIVREAMDFRSEVRESDEVKFALQVFNALDSSNYVKFFRLFRSASYLNACIMHRYLDQVRRKALQIMKRAYSIQNRPVSFPVEDAVRILAFDSSESAIYYYEHHGFTVNESAVLLSKSSNNDPEDKYPVARSQLIDRKRVVSFGEIVNGGSLNQLPEYHPTISFDDNGVYNGQYHRIALVGVFGEPITIEINQSDLAEDVSTSDSSCATSQQFEQIPHLPSAPTQTGDAARAQFLETQLFKRSPDLAPPPMQITKEDVKDFCKELISGVISNQIKDLANDTLLEEKVNDIAVNQIAEHIIARTIVSDTKEVVTQAILIERMRKAEEKQQEINKLTLEFTESVLRQGVESQLRCLVSDALRQEECKLIERIKSKEISNLTAEMISAVIHTEVRAGITDVMDSEWQRKKDLLMVIHDQIVLKKIKQHLDRWKRQFKKQKELKELLFEFPSMKPLKTSQSIVKTLAVQKTKAGILYLFSDGDHLLPSIQRRRKKHRDAIAKYHQYLNEERNLMSKPIVVESVLRQCLAIEDFRKCMKKKTPMFMKIVISHSVSSVDNSQQKSRLLSAETVVKKFTNKSQLSDSISNVENVETITLDSFSIGGQDVYLCIQHMQGNCATETDELIRERVFYGTTGAIFLLENPVDDQSYWAEANAQLHTVTLSKPSNPKIPLLVVVLGQFQGITEENVISKLQLNNLKAEGLIVEYDCIFVSAKETARDIEEKLTLGFGWLLEYTPSLPDVKVTSLESYVMEGLSMLFFSRVYEDLEDKGIRGINIQQTPGPYLELYNSVISHLADACSLDEYRSLSWPAKEFSDVLYLESAWNSSQGLQRVRNLITCLHLPQSLPLNGNETIMEQSALCWEYISALLQDPLNKGQETLLLNRVGHVLESWSRKRDLNPYSKSNSFFPWLSVVEEIISFTFSTRNLAENYKYNLPVIASMVREHVPPKSWHTHRKIGAQEISLVASIPTKSSIIKSQVDETEKELAKIEGKLATRAKTAEMEEKQLATGLRTVNERMFKLEETLFRERLEASRFKKDISRTQVDEPSTAVSKRKRSDETSINEEDVSPTKRSQVEKDEGKKHDIILLEENVESFLDDLKTTKAALLSQSLKLEVLTME